MDGPGDRRRVKRISLQHRLEFAGLRLLEIGLGALPKPIADRVGARIGDLLRWPLGIRRRMVEANVRRAFPDATPEWIDRVVRESYRHLGREVVSMLRLSQLDPAGVNAVVEVPDEDWAGFEEALAEGNGVILATGHYGNWEMAAAAVAARGVPIAAIVKAQSNRLVDAHIERARRRLGVETVDMARAPRRIPRDLAANKGIGIVGDQDARSSGVWVDFFGVPASTYRGPALFALRYDAPVIAAVCRRLPDGRYRLSGKRIPVERTESLEADIGRVTAILAARLEAQIREDPTQYFWFHNRWRTRPPEEPASLRAGTTPHGGRAPSGEPEPASPRRSDDGIQ